MGLMQGKIDGDTMIVMDAFALPVEGTETRVNAEHQAIPCVCGRFSKPGRHLSLELAIACALAPHNVLFLVCPQPYRLTRIDCRYMVQYVGLSEKVCVCTHTPDRLSPIHPTLPTIASIPAVGDLARSPPPCCPRFCIVLSWFCLPLAIRPLWQVGRMENVLGWYHSHPSYGCWLSGIDVSTQTLNQQHQDPWLAIVVRLRTLACQRLRARYTT